MAKKVTGKQVKKGILFSVGAQIVSLGVSLLLNLIVPKFISELDYANWQTYMLYVGYVGILHFGLLDGIMLRYSEYDYDELDKEKLSSQFIILLSLLNFAFLIVFGIGIIQNDYITKIVFIMVALAIFSRNIYTYTSYTFQMTNRIGMYASLVILQRLFYAIGILCLLLFRVKGFIWFCIVDISADTLGNLYGVLNNKGLYLGKMRNISSAIKEAYINISSGIILLAANWSSMLLIGGAKMIVQWHWTRLTFGKVSFAFSVSNLFLTFVTAISVVLFPSLKRLDKESLPNMYVEIRNAVSLVLFIAMTMYYPGAYILSLWLPKYGESLVYLGILLPIIVFSSKVSLLTNNYLKAYRAERKMLIINITSVVLALILYLISAYILDDLSLVMVSVVIAVMFRSIISEIVVSRIIGKQFLSEYITELMITTGFIMSTRLFSLLKGAIIYLIILAIYLLMKKNEVGRLFHKVKF